MDFFLSIQLILLIISLGLNLLLIFLLVANKTNQLKKISSSISLDDAFFVLNSVIDSQRPTFFRGLAALSKKYAILGSDGSTQPPNDRVEDYAKKKKDLKIAITKKVNHNLSEPLRSRLLEFYSDYGLASYITLELEKESPQPPTQLLTTGGLS